VTRKKPSQQENRSKGQETSEIIATHSRGGGQPKPKTPSGEVKLWKTPDKGTTPSNRKK
jgi:hypothetical protein